MFSGKKEKSIAAVGETSLKTPKKIGVHILHTPTPLSLPPDDADRQTDRPKTHTQADAETNRHTDTYSRG